MQTSEATIFCPSVPSYQEIIKKKKSFCIKFCQVFFGGGGGGGGKLPRPGYLHPRGASCPEAALPLGGKLPRVGGARYPGISSPQRQLHPWGASCPECKIKTVHWLISLLSLLPDSSKYSITKQLMHSVKVKIRIFQPEKVMFCLSEHYFLELTNPDVNMDRCMKCIMFRGNILCKYIVTSYTCN